MVVLPLVSHYLVIVHLKRLPPRRVTTPSPSGFPDLDRGHRAVSVRKDREN
jgi:hypothetical protein